MFKRRDKKGRRYNW